MTVPSALAKVVRTSVCWPGGRSSVIGCPAAYVRETIGRPAPPATRPPLHVADGPYTSSRDIAAPETSVPTSEPMQARLVTLGPHPAPATRASHRRLKWKVRE